MASVVRRPAVTAASTGVLARQWFGMAGEVCELPSGRDRNFELKARSGRFVLRIAHADDRVEWLEYQNAVPRRLPPATVPAARPSPQSSRTETRTT